MPRPAEKDPIGVPDNIAPLPFWDHRREWLRLTEVPLFIKYFFNVKLSRSYIYKWCREGKKDVHTGKQIYLNTRLMFKKIYYVHKQDLMAFILRT